MVKAVQVRDVEPKKFDPREWEEAVRMSVPAPRPEEVATYEAPAHWAGIGGISK